MTQCNHTLYLIIIGCWSHEQSSGGGCYYVHTGRHGKESHDLEESHDKEESHG